MFLWSGALDSARLAEAEREVRHWAIQEYDSLHQEFTLDGVIRYFIYEAG